jgi:mRNA interferase RelE/StbE
MNYKVIVSKSVERQIRKIPRKFQERILNSIDRLRTDPHPTGSLKLESRNLWRIRVGDYRLAGSTLMRPL